MWSDDLDGALLDWHGERVISESRDGRFAVWQNVDSGSWTVVEYHAAGHACVLGQGAHWPPHADGAMLVAELPL